MHYTLKNHQIRQKFGQKWKNPRWNSYVGHLNSDVGIPMSNIGIPTWVFQLQPRNSEAREPTTIRLFRGSPNMQKEYYLSRTTFPFSSLHHYYGELLCGRERITMGLFTNYTYKIQIFFFRCSSSCPKNVASSDFWSSYETKGGRHIHQSRVLGQPRGIFCRQH